MRETEFDLLVIGGGINGVGIARDAAGRGLSVLLVEQDDLAQHTSSASTKLIHGGLRYLEYCEFRLVREALRERERFLSLAPHLVRPLEFVLPQTETSRPRWMLHAGLALYDRLGGRTRLPRSRSIQFVGELREGLQPSIRRGFSYSDCRVDDSRLVILNAVDAARRGAHIRPRTRFLGASRDQDGWRCTLLDVGTGVATNARARALVNAAGPWVCDILNEHLNIASAKSVRLVKGSHIIVPRLHGGEHAFMLQNPDRRVVFVIPYEERFSLVGTTEVAIASPHSAPEISPDEIEYLCASANRYFAQHIAPSDVVQSFSGIRPLFEDAAKDATAVTRDYVLDIDVRDGEAPLLSIFGGKITTYRKLAEQALHKLARYLPDAAGAWTAHVPLPGGDMEESFEDFAAKLHQRFAFLPRSLAVRLARAYGTLAFDILGHASTLTDLGTHFGAGLYEAEIEHMIRYEWARTGDDVLLRRSKMSLHLSQQEAERIREYVARRCGAGPAASAVTQDGRRRHG